MEGLELLKKSRTHCELLPEFTPVFSVFIRNYEVGKNGFNIHRFKHGEDLIQFSSVTYFGRNNYENSISHFFDLSELKEEINHYRDKIDEYHCQGFIKICLLDINDSILLGVEGENVDTIWKLNGDWGDIRPYKEKLADNIFEFINCFKEVFISINLIARRVEKKRLYKNWGEDFWRVREEVHDE